MKILKVKILKGGSLLSLSFKEEALKAHDDKTCKQQVHPDLVNAVNKLIPHFALLTDCINDDQYQKNEGLDKYTVVGYSIGGKDDDQCITITGYRLTSRGKTYTFNAPREYFEASEDTRYKYMDELQDVVEEIESEVIKYLTQGKRAPDPQKEIEFPDQGPASEEEELTAQLSATIEKPKKKSGKAGTKKKTTSKRK